MYISIMKQDGVKERKQNLRSSTGTKICVFVCSVLIVLFSPDIWKSK